MDPRCRLSTWVNPCKDEERKGGMGKEEEEEKLFPPYRPI